VITLRSDGTEIRHEPGRWSLGITVPGFPSPWPRPAIAPAVRLRPGGSKNWLPETSTCLVHRGRRGPRAHQEGAPARHGCPRYLWQTCRA